MHYPSLFVRGSYCLTLIGAPVFAVVFAASWLAYFPALDVSLLIPFTVLSIYCRGALSAWRRIARDRSSLIPSATISASPVISSLVALTSLLGTLAMLVTLSVMLDPKLPGSDVGGPLTMFIFLTLFLYGLALLTAEWVLVGSDSTHGNSRRPSAPL